MRRPTFFYRTELWRFGLWVVRVMPRTPRSLLCRACAAAYRTLQPRRREVVVRNLLPVYAGDRPAAERRAREVFREFSFKMADLWRVEGGAPLDHWTFEMHGWDLFAAARDRGRGVLLVSPHLGNWELGGPLLARQGVELIVITQPEPDTGLTELRQASRARWGIETFVVGQDAFAFIEIIKRLQEGATAALLVDRPPTASAVTVELCGRPFLGSVAAAELARAAGCAVLGVYVVRTPGGYQAVVMTEFVYDRRALGAREGRRQFTQQILRAFEPVIRQHADQWFHFVPIWPDGP